MVKTIISLMLSVCFLIPGAAVLAQNNAQSVTLQQEWDNPIDHIVDGWTEFLSGERVVLYVNRNGQMTAGDLFQQLSSMIEGYPLMAYYEYIDEQTGQLIQYSDAVADSYTMGAQVLDANFPDDYFRITQDGYLEFLQTGTIAVDFLVEFYHDTAWGGEMSRNYMMVDVVIA